jgi:hypothetical protein
MFTSPASRSITSGDHTGLLGADTNMERAQCVQDAVRDPEESSLVSGVHGCITLWWEKCEGITLILVMLICSEEIALSPQEPRKEHEGHSLIACVGVK